MRAAVLGPWLREGARICHSSLCLLCFPLCTCSMLPGSATTPGSPLSPEMCLFLPLPAKNKQALDVRMSQNEQEVSLARQEALVGEK